MKECFIITAYCDTENKRIALKEQIKRLKQFNIDICIYSHYPLEPDIQKSVNYSLFSSDNPIFTDTISNLWYKIPGYTLHKSSYDYGYCVFKMIRESLFFLNNAGYEKFFILNYDLNVEQPLLNKMKEYNNVFFFYTPNFPLLALISVDNSFLDKIRSLTPEKYKEIMKQGFLYGEEFLYEKILNDFNYKKHFLTLDEANSILKYEIGFDSRSGIKVVKRDDGYLDLLYDNFSIFKRGKYRFFAGRIDKKDTFGFLFWDVKEKTEVEIITRDFQEKFSITNTLFFDTKINFDEFVTKYIGKFINGVFKSNSNISIKIDGLEIDQQLLRLMPQLKIEID